MSETVLKILLSELDAVRIVCKNQPCGGVVEVKLADLGRFYKSGNCPLCGKNVVDKDDNDLLKLAEAVRGLQAQEDDLDIEFVVRQPIAT